MAKQEGHMPIKGTLNNLTYYQSKGQNLVRKKSSLTGDKVKTDPAFEHSRRSSSRFALGQSIASTIYKKLLPQGGKETMFRQMMSEAILFLKQGIEEKDVAKKLTRKYKTKLNKENKK